jgi:hypothetical protein
MTLCVGNTDPLTAKPHCSAGAPLRPAALALEAGDGRIDNPCVRSKAATVNAFGGPVLRLCLSRGRRRGAPPDPHAVSGPQEWPPPAHKKSQPGAIAGPPEALRA